VPGAVVFCCDRSEVSATVAAVRTVASGVWVAILLVVAPAAVAQLRAPLFLLRPVLGAVEDRFGNGLATVGDEVLVAAHNEDAPGAASIYDLRTGASTATFQASVPAENDGFGSRVAASRRLLAILGTILGTPGVFVYGRTHELFGVIELDPCGLGAMAVRGRRIAMATGCGASVIDWPGVPRTVPRPPADTNEYFGWAIAIAAGRVLIGSPHFAEADGPGRVYAFDVRTGTPQWEARALDATNGDGFGAALAMVGSRVLVGAPLDDRDGPDTGSVHLLDAATGRVRRRYANPSGRSGENFGHAVAGDRHVVLVGAPYAAVNESGAGVGYVLDARTGALRETLAPRPNEADANAGRAVAITASRYLVGGSDWSGIGMVGVFDR
jgi:FG-GAP repeat